MAKKSSNEEIRASIEALKEQARQQSEQWAEHCRTLILGLDRVPLGYEELVFFFISWLILMAPFAAEDVLMACCSSCE